MSNIMLTDIYSILDCSVNCICVFQDLHFKKSNSTIIERKSCILVCNTTFTNMSKPMMKYIHEHIVLHKVRVSVQKNAYPLHP